ncbi:ABC transporter ATP-binding protein [Tomitella gaofuii]|uniref:ABC transporter ATP-binding protein n=1 Tax=Tomitella gaofuii TaxID=2760083 RepID=UPI0015F9A1A9|nr:ABC transporter ATP-binding protein [Tomitella gaofuii]
MIRALFEIVPAEKRSGVRRFAVLTAVSIVLRAVGVVMLVPLVAAWVDDDHAAALGWLGGLTLATVGGWAVEFRGSREGYAIGFGMLDNGQHRVTERLARIPMSWFNQDNKATARQAIATTGPDLVGVVAYLVVPVANALLLPLAIACALFAVAWQLALVALAGVPLLLGTLWLARAISDRADEVADDTNARLSERVIEFARTQQALRVSRRVEPARSMVGRAVAEQHGAAVRLMLMQVPGRVLFSIAGWAALFALAGTTAWLTVRGDLSTAEAVALIVVAVRYLEPFTTLGELSGGLEAARLSLRKIASVLQAPTPASGTVLLPGGAAPPRIEFDKVCFRYGDAADDVLHDLDLVIEAGGSTAIIGPSGSGKSTVLGLIAGLYEPTAGRVLIDGVDAAELDPASRRAVTSVVFQQPYLISGTIAENIAAGDPAASQDRLAAVADRARVDEIVHRLPDGMHTDVGEGGGVLSGGERQRVSIARALAKPSPVLLIDEATSALDHENERAVVAALTGEERRRTRVIVAHRRAAVAQADRVVVMDGGRIVESGEPARLREEGGYFADFLRGQDAGGGWRITDSARGRDGSGSMVAP